MTPRGARLVCISRVSTPNSLRRRQREIALGIDLPGKRCNLDVAPIRPSFAYASMFEM